MGSAVPASGSPSAVLQNEQRAIDALIPRRAKTQRVVVPPPAPAPVAPPLAAAPGPHEDHLAPARAQNSEGFTQGPLPGVVDTGAFQPSASVHTRSSGLHVQPAPATTPPPAPAQPPFVPNVAIGPLQQAAPPASPTAARDAMVARLEAAKYKVVSTSADGVVRLQGSVPGYPLPVDIFIPPNYEHDAAGESLNIHLHGHLLGSSVESSVFNNNDFAALLAASHSPSALVVPHSADFDATFNSQFVADRGGFDRFAKNLATTMGVAHFVRPSLSTHSGSGYIGDEIILHSKLGADVGVRVHLDDGFVTPESFAGRWQTRKKADDRVAANQGTVVSLGIAGLDGATMSNGVNYNRTTHNAPSTHDAYWIDSKGKSHRRVMIDKGMAMPRSDYQSLLNGPAFTGPFVNYEVAGVKPPKDSPVSPHWYIQNLLSKAWAIPNQ